MSFTSAFRRAAVAIAAFNRDSLSSTLDSVFVRSSWHEQVIQSLEGGIIHSLMVREGDIVERGQQLAQLDRTKTESSVLESESRLNAAMASSAGNVSAVSFTSAFRRAAVAIAAFNRDSLSSTLDSVFVRSSWASC